MGIKTPLALCIKCNDGVLKPCIGKREKSRCRYHWTIEHRRSARGKSDDMIYKELRLEHLKEFPDCQIGLPDICTKVGSEIHHPGGRHGGGYLEKSTFKTTCRACHRYIEDHPQFAYEHGHSIARLLPKPVQIVFENIKVSTSLKRKKI